MSHAATGGTYDYHDDDCRCSGPCVRDGYVWSCCGAFAEASSCAGTVTTGTYADGTPLTEAVARTRGQFLRVHHTYNGTNSSWTDEQRTCCCVECTPATAASG